MTDKTLMVIFAALFAGSLIYIGYLHNDMGLTVGREEVQSDMIWQLIDRETERDEHVCNGTEVPEWFIDEFNRTFLGSYSITVEDDILNIVIITSGKRFYDLRETIGFTGTLRSDIKIDVGKWEYLDPDVTTIHNTPKPDEMSGEVGE